MQEEVTQKTVTFCIRTTKVTADLLKKVLAAYLRHQKQKSVEKKAKKNQPKQGKVTVKELAKQNAGMVNIEITNKNIKSFERYARKYGINYALKKDKSKEEILKDIWCFLKDVIRMPSMLLSVSFPRNRFKKRISLLFTSVLQLTEQ